MGIFTNTAHVSANETDTNTGNNTDTENTIVHPANLSITKSGPDSVRVGSPLTYTLTIANHGPNNAENVILTDTLPASVNFHTCSAGASTCNHSSGTVTSSLGNLSNGNSRVVTIVVTPTVAGTITNTAQINSNNPDLIASNNTATATTTIDPVTDLTISKSASPSPVTAGASLTYTITITNNGPSNATGIMVTDILPAGLTFSSASGCNHNNGMVTCTLSSLAQGNSHSFVFAVEVNPGARGVITNTATVTGNEYDPVANNSASVGTLINAVTNLALNKRANPTIATPGAPLTYTLIITNNGPSNATGLVITDTLPAGVSFNSGSAGCSGGSVVTCTLSGLLRNNSHAFTLNTGVVSSITQTLQNSARVTSIENSTGISATLNTGVLPQADLDITKTASPGAALPGDIITYVITVYNNGPSDATGIVVTDTLPADVTFQSVTPGTPTCSGTGTIVCTLGNLEANGTPLEVTIEVVVNQEVTGTISNQATVSGNEEDPSEGNNISPLVNTAIGDFYKIYLPIILKPAPVNLYIENDTSGQVIFSVFGTGVSCTVPAGDQNYHCGDFPPGTYTVQAITMQCGTGTSVRTYVSGYQSTRVFCN
jgi:uncharacterized repeat protein (TIGR01451 family)